MRLPDSSPGNGHSNGDSGNMTSNVEPDFSEFMWMAEEDLEAFDNEVRPRQSSPRTSQTTLHPEEFGYAVISEVAEVMMQQQRVANNGCLIDDEEEFLQRMLEEEEERETVYYSQYNGDNRKRTNDVTELTSNMQRMGVSQDMAAKSTLNPYAEEFVPAERPNRCSNPPDLIQCTETQEKGSS